MKFNGDPQQLGFFLAHVLAYMQEYGPEIPTEDAKVRSITLALEGAEYHVRIREGDEWKTYFNCLLACFQFKVLLLASRAPLLCSCN